MLQSISPIAVQPKHLKMAQTGLEQFLKRTDIGFPQLPQRQELWDQSQAHGQYLRENFKHLVLVGIGGSSMGARALVDVFSQASSANQLHICDNVDEVEFQALLGRGGQPKDTAWLIISKSGSTIETMLTLEFVLQIYRQAGLEIKNHVSVITEPRSNPLADFAKSHGCKSLPIPLDVGGRFSVLSPVGLVPAAYLGLKIEDFKLGAQDALAQGQLISNVSAAVLESYQREEWITMFWSYSSGLRNFGGWMAQLWAESLAKSVDRKGKTAPRATTPMAAVGACDQHSLLQQVMEGTHDKFVIFQRVKSSEGKSVVLKKSELPSLQFMQGRSMGELLAAEAEATSQALTQVGVQNISLMMADLSPRSLGELFMFWQLVVACLGECLDIDAFNQPGVELGKRLARTILQR